MGPRRAPGEVVAASCTGFFLDGTELKKIKRRRELARKRGDVFIEDEDEWWEKLQEEASKPVPPPAAEELEIESSRCAATGALCVPATPSSTGGFVNPAKSRVKGA
eukprot:s2771_g11.t1